MNDNLSELRNLKNWLTIARANQGLTQKQLAARTGMDAAWISRIEQGQNLPTVPQLFQLAKVLAVSLQWFINGRNHPESELVDIAIELQNLGIGDLLVPNAMVPGAFRATEEIIALAICGDQPEPRIIDALPAVLAWNRWSHTVLRAYSQRQDPRAGIRLAWLADVALAIDKTWGFPGGCPQKRELEVFVRWWHKRAMTLAREDDLGRPADQKAISPVSKRWKITYAASLPAFAARAEELHLLLEQQRGRSTARRP
jgi:transcriptional regulator with XRE-family HTH domain